jgi:hypothetical protein
MGGGEPAREGRTAVYQENSTIEQPKNPFPHLAVIAVRHVETQEVSSVRRFAESKGHQFDPG